MCSTTEIDADPSQETLASLFDWDSDVWRVNLPLLKHPGKWLLALALSVAIALPALASDRLLIAAASDLRYALDDIVGAYRQVNPDARIDVIYGSSGKMTTQIVNGAPYDVFFSADIAFPRLLEEQGLTATKPEVYAIGRIVIWSNTRDASGLTLADLADDRIGRIAIAQPAHAPYGMRAREALMASGVWEAVQSKLVFGENIAQTAQMTQSGAAEVGIIALSLALFPDLSDHNHHLIDDSLHTPLTQGFVVTRRAADNPEAFAFADFMASEQAHRIMTFYGFVPPSNRLLPEP